ncbi:probable cytochrome P450 6a13 [Pogonomyrmex barbatus]|uniref:Probable cytochrome P450 6a13 n=1 Tax=Pogonomyrmex barbatus TaxID=144034 RepID=A0A6I9WJA0_9HYME|nr:probable cytochrome P450 6a13 [Pogonomyrmex barbatus]
MDVTVVLLSLVVLVILYFYLTRNFKYWQKRGVPCASGAVPGLGHMWDVVRMKINFSEFSNKIYDDNRNHSMVGFYNFMTPSLFVLEPELVKTVLQTNFTNFHENGLKINPDLDPLLANNPFFNYGEKWIIGRKRLTYAFSSMRLKILLESVKQVCEKFENYVDKKLGKTGRAELELKELFARFTSQVVAGAGFGVDGMSFDDEKEKESFYTMGKSFLEGSSLNNLIFTFVLFIPSLGKMLRMRLVPKKIDHFFRTLVVDIMEQRRRETTRRNDFLQLMVDLEKTEGDEFDSTVLASHAMSFFVDGNETSNTTLSFIGYNLATNPKVQEKLREEVISVLNKYDGVITYEALREMTYMDQVISESQRITPALGFLSKICTEDIEIKGSDGVVCRVERGTPVLIPIHALAKDPRYWENPEEFDPDRFGPDRKNSIERFAFLPFGEGPRICVGMRMALLQMKACLATFLRKYSLELSPKTQLPLKYNSALLNTVEGGIWGIIRPL